MACHLHVQCEVRSSANPLVGGPKAPTAITTTAMHVEMKIKTPIVPNARSVTAIANPEIIVASLTPAA
jgi:hypothetical protein